MNKALSDFIFSLHICLQHLLMCLFIYFIKPKKKLVILFELFFIIYVHNMAGICDSASHLHLYDPEHM